jgi:hypothetical protein
MKTVLKHGNRYSVKRISKAKHYGGIAEQIRKRREAIEAGNRAMEAISAEINAPGGPTFDDKGTDKDATPQGGNT